MATLRKRVYHTLNITWAHKRGFGFLINLFLTVIITLNTVAIILHTVPRIGKKYDELFLDFELFSVIVFSIEYGLRMWSCVENPAFKHPIKGRLKFLFSTWGLIDLLAIFPFYFSLFTTDLGFVRIFRIFRMFRLFKISRYSHALSVIQRVVNDKREELILSMSFIIFLLLIFSSLMFFVEHDAQPKKFASIPDSLWWGVNAMTTVGYGDIHPITPLGKVLGGLFSILGVSIFALPTGILASGFAEHVRSYRKPKTTTCPHCGKDFSYHEYEEHH